MRPLLLACLASVLLAASASANPIRVTVEAKSGDMSPDGYFDPWNRAHRVGVLAQVALTDDFLNPPARGSQIYLGSPPNTGFVWRPESYHEQWGGWADFTLTFDRLTEGPAQEGSPTIHYAGILDGFIGVDDDGRAYGWAVADSISVTLANWTMDSDIPRDVVDLFLDPRAVTLASGVINGRFGSMETVLRINPAAVPEPSTIAAWGVVGLGALAIRRRR